MKVARTLVLFLLVCLAASAANAQSCQSCSYYAAGCYTTPTGVTGNTGCSNNFPPASGCAYWGSSCSNGQYGPPTLGDYCNYVDPSSWFCRPLEQDPGLITCAPSLKDEIFRHTPIPGRAVRVIRSATGSVIVFEHAI